MKIEKKPANLKGLIDAVLSSVVIPTGIALQTQIAVDFPEIKVDSQLIKRVLINLVNNAVQSMPEGGALTLKSHINPKGQVIVTVEDTGVGIPDRIKPHIFTPLFTTKPRGQGFGLAVCKRVIEAHGGNIVFESQEGKGTKFIIQFPAS
jgi:signal transduction histidine kinase